MKVKELIALLAQQPQDKKIEFYDNTAEQFISLESVEQYMDESTGKITEIFLNFTY